MKNALEEKRMQWVRDNIPLLVMRSEEEIRRLVTRATRDTQPYQLMLAIAMVLATTFLNFWLQDNYLDDTSGRAEQYIIVIATASVFAFVMWYLNEQLFRRRIRKLAGAAYGTFQ